MRQVDLAFVVVLSGCTGIAPVIGQSEIARFAHNRLLFDVMHPVQVRIQRVLTSVLLAALRANDDSVLTPKVHIFDVPF